MNEKGIKILSKYYIPIGGLHCSYGGYSSHENNFVNLNFIVCLIAFDKRCKNIRLFVGTRRQDNLRQLYEE